MSAGADRADALHGGSLRTHAARGTLITSAFVVGLGLLQLARGFLLAKFLTPEDYGVWGILLVSLGTLGWLKQIGISDKYLQQDEDDQERAFQKAFTLEALSNVALGVLVAVAVPVMAAAYGEPQILAPGFALLALLPAVTLQAPLWILLRRMRYARQRTLQAIDPVLGLVVALALAIAGAGFWAFVLAAIAGAWATALVAWRTSPYPMRFAFDARTARSYVAFSGPLFVASLGGIVVAQGAILAGQAAGGLAAAGAITLASAITQFVNKVDQVLTDTLYPAICAVADRTEVLFETFVKSNRLALMWAMPFGFGLALFAGDLVGLGLLDEDWQPAVVVLQAFGVAAAVGHLGFNWTAYCKALGRTRPIAVFSVASAIAFLAVELPLVLTLGLDGLALGTLVLVAVALAVRWVELRTIFPGARLAPHAARALAPALPGVAAVLAVRALAGGERGAALVAGELALYLAVTAAATVLAERALLAEALGYLRARRPPAPAAPAVTRSRA
jgi:PST family polysaccharide transporter